jgi:PAS domain S-box-containing protein
MKTLLIVEDEPLHLDQMKEVLWEHGTSYRLLEADKISTALARIQKYQPDIIITDYHLPDGRGTEILRTMYDQAPVILMSAYGDEQLAVKAIKQGAMDYLVKKKEQLGQLPGILERAFREWTLMGEQKRLKKELEDEKKKYKSLFEESNDAVFIHTLEGRFLDVNQRGMELLELSKDRLLASSVLDFHQDETREQGKEFLQKTLEQGSCRFETTICKASGEKAEVEISARIFDAEKGLIQGILRDITRHKQTLEDLRAVNSMKDRLLSIVAHDLKNPMNQIMGFTELLVLKMQDLGPEKVALFHKKIFQSTKNLYMLLENLLDWYRLQREVVTLNPKVEDLKKLTGKSMQLYQLQADDQEIQLRNGVFDEEMVWTDPIIAQTILRNLLSNALKFTNSKGFIEVSSQRLEEKVIVQVKDNGMGMSTEKSRQLFGPVPVHSRRGIQGEQGTGLGLKICKEFMDKLGERIWVESEPGKGTSFYFTLPVAFGFRYHPSVMRQ